MEFTLSNIYKRRKSNRDLFHELMTFKIKDILLVATYYDAYTIIREEQFSDKIFGEFLQLNLYVSPRFVSVSSDNEALQKIKTRHFDLIILMAGIDKEHPIELSKKIKKLSSDIPILILANNNSDLAYFESIKDKIKKYIDRIFVWNGSTKIFMAMVKYIEDKMNLRQDVKIGDVRIILLVEDSIKYYSRYLPILYTQLMMQTQELIGDDEVGLDELYKLIQMRVRPKLILVSTLQEAKKIIQDYENNLLCLITDVNIIHRKKTDYEAGIRLVKYIHNKNITIPIVIQSSDTSNALKASKLGVYFINKLSETLSIDIKNFLREKLGFGSFVFRNQADTKIAEAFTMQDFEELFKTIPDESIIHHGDLDDFSKWLMAHGEIYIAKRLRNKRANEFATVDEIRQYCLNLFNDARLKQLRGRIIPFRARLLNSNKYIIRLGKGSLGGKGRSIAFINNFIESINFKELIPNINIEIPKTAIIGVEEYDNFIEINNLQNIVLLKKDYKQIQSRFLNSKLKHTLSEKLRKYLNAIKTPLAVRSSGLFEDSLNRPFAGVYATYYLPNNHENPDERLQHLEDAIKLIYASIFTPSSQDYFKAVGYKIEEEKMAIVIQELVGEIHNNKFYPNISGVAQSYNFYPFSYMKPEDGFSVIAIGLGNYVMDGEKAYRLCPKYPKLLQMTVNDQLKNLQQYFYALDMSQKDIHFLNSKHSSAIKKYNISEAEKDGTLNHCASVYDYQNDRIESGLNIKGPRIIDFADILKYDFIPLAKTLNIVLRMFQQAMGTPVEMEFAIDLNLSKTKSLPTFYLLQIRPLMYQKVNISLNLDEIEKDKILIYSSKGMGNGKINHIRDIVYVDIDKFDRTKTQIMAKEAEYFNKKFNKVKKEYILIGPGRWGTKDKFTGIPVIWTQISRAKVIVEQGLEDFPLDASLGSHFFHNVTSMNIGYFSVNSDAKNTIFNYDILEKQKEIEKLKYLKHIRFNKPLKVIMDGTNQQAVVTFEN